MTHELEPHLFAALGEAGGTFGLESLMCQLYSMRHRCSNQKVDPVFRGLYEVACIQYNAYNDSGQSCMLPMVSVVDPDLKKALVHERFHYWHLMSTPAMIIAILGHLRLIQEYLIAFEADYRKQLTLTPLFQFKVLAAGEHNNNRLLARTVALMALHNESRKTVNKAHAMEAAEWLNLLGYLKCVVNWTRVEFVEKPDNFSVWFRLNESTFIARSQEASLLDVVIRYSGSRATYSVVPMSSVTLLESAAYVAECLYCERHPAFPNDDDMTTDWYLYREPWITWYQVYGDLFQDKGKAEKAFIATIDLALCTDWLGQMAHEFPSDMQHPDMQDQMVSPSNRFTMILREWPTLREELGSVTKGRDIDLAAYQKTICHVMGWPEPRQVVRRLLEYLVAHQLIIYSFFGLYDADAGLRFADLRRPEVNDEELTGLIKSLYEVKLKTGVASPVFGQGVLDVMIWCLHSRLESPGGSVFPLWKEDIVLWSYAGLGTLPLPVLWVNDQIAGELGLGGSTIDFVQYMTLHQAGRTENIDAASAEILVSLSHSDKRVLVQLDRLAQQAPLRCGIEKHGIPCDFVYAGQACPSGAQGDNPRVKTVCHFRRVLDKLGVRSLTRRK